MLYKCFVFESRELTLKFKEVKGFYIDMVAFILSKLQYDFMR